MSATFPPPGRAVRAIVAGVGAVYGEIVEARINGGRIALALWGSGKTIVVGPDEIEGIEVVDLSGAEVVAIAARQRSNPDIARKNRRAVMP